MAVKVKVSIKETDMGAKRIREEIEKLAKEPYLKIGIQGTDASQKKKVRDSTGKSGVAALTVVEVGTFHEFGTTSKEGDQIIPARSFLRGTMDENKSKFKHATEGLLKQVYKGTQTVDSALGILGSLIQGKIQQRIRSGIKPALKHRKGTPLYDTGQLVQSIRYVKVMDGKGEKK